MTAKEVIETHQQDGSQELEQLQLKPGLSQFQMEEFESRLAVPLSKESRELLAFTSGFFFRPFGEVNFLGVGMPGLEEIVPVGLAIAADGTGNDWVIDISRETGAWGPIVYLAHDPPVVVIQAPNLVIFLEQIFDLGHSKRNNQLEFVSSAAAHRIWSDDPYLLSRESCQRESDPVLENFCRDLPETFHVADLRALEIGSGFSWGRSGPDTRIERCGSEFLFGVEIEVKKSFLSRLLKRKS